MLTLEDIKEKLKQLDETILLELLNISSDQIVERFEDLIIDREDYFIRDLEEDEWNEV